MSYHTTQRGLQWHYQISGRGDPIVFIHGFGGSGQWWQGQRAFLESDFQVITVDLPGHGQSAWMPVTVMGMAIDIQQIIQAEGIEQFNIVASSFGTLVAFELYRLMGAQLMRMSLVGGLPKFARCAQYPAGLDIDKIRKLGGQFNETGSVAGVNGDYGSVLGVFVRSLFTMKERDSASFKQFKEIRLNEPLPNLEALRSFLTILENIDLRDRLSSVICPVQLVSGREDYICPPAMMQWVQEHIPNARLDVIDGCGHLPFLTETAEYNRLLEDFLLN